MRQEERMKSEGADDVAQRTVEIERERRRRR
jgi:hypothetical protein